MRIAGSCFKFMSKYNEHFYNDNHCYNANHCWDGGMSYHEAAKRCRDSGGRLAVLNTSEKIEKTIEFIKEKVAQSQIYSGNYWIGASVDHTKQPQWDTPVGKSVSVMQTQLTLLMKFRLLRRLIKPFQTG